MDLTLDHKTTFSLFSLCKLEREKESVVTDISKEENAPKHLLKPYSQRVYSTPCVWGEKNNYESTGK